MDIRLEQFISHVLEFTLQNNRDTLNGLVIQGEIELCHLYIGSEHNMWHLDYDKYQHLLPICELQYML